MLLIPPKIKISIKIELSKNAPLARARIFDAVVSAALTLKTLTLTDCNRRQSSGNISSYIPSDS